MNTYYFLEDVNNLGLPYSPQTTISKKKGDQISGIEFTPGFVTWHDVGGMYIIALSKLSTTPIQSVSQPGPGSAPNPAAGPNYLYWGIGTAVVAALGFATYWFGFRKKSKII